MKIKINTELKRKFTSLIVVASVMFALMLGINSTATYAVTTEQSASCGANISLSYSAECDEKEKARKDCPASNPKCKPSGEIEKLISTIINVISAIVGAIAVIMIIIGGFRFVTAGGDTNNVSSAKNTIMYAIVGLVIVAFAQVIVRFVLQRI